MKLLLVGVISTETRAALANMLVRADTVISLPEERQRTPRELLTLAQEVGADMVLVESIASEKNHVPTLDQILSLKAVTVERLDLRRVPLEHGRSYPNHASFRSKDRRDSARIRAKHRQRQTKIPR